MGTPRRFAAVKAKHRPNRRGGALFLVGRIDRKGRRIVFVNEPGQPPFPGPWELHAVFTI